MIEGNIMASVKIFISFLVITFMVGIGIFLFQIQQVNNFKQYVNYEIERNGGLTSQAIQRIENYSNEHYGGRFSVNSPQMNQKYEYGSVIDYEIDATFEVLFIDIANQNYQVKGSAVSLIR